MLFKRIAALALCALLLTCMPGFAMNRAEMRDAWQAAVGTRSDASPYLEKPDTAAFLPGALTEEAQQDALRCLNFLRKIAGLQPVQINPLYTLRAQAGAMLLAANDQLDHNSPMPAGMNEDLYQTAHMGTSQGNIAKFNWMKPDILLDGVRYFVRDDGEANLAVLGHRRWLLNPAMAETGFGLANSQSGMSYVTMYAVDTGNAGAAWDYVAWPANGTFPVEMMRADLPWSISLNDAIYDLSASRIRVELTEEGSGTAFAFDIAAAEGDGYCGLSKDNCGSGSCIIFRPDIAGAGITEYVQNQIWTVRITGLKTAAGDEAEIQYRCEMASLYPQEAVNVEMQTLEAQLSVGEPLRLQANVIPAYADDLSVSWSSSNSDVATVSRDGMVLAVGPGECEITAETANGRSDFCRITVLPPQDAS